LKNIKIIPSLCPGTPENTSIND